MNVSKDAPMTFGQAYDREDMRDLFLRSTVLKSSGIDQSNLGMI